MLVPISLRSCCCCCYCCCYCRFCLMLVVFFSHALLVRGLKVDKIKKSLLKANVTSGTANYERGLAKVHKQTERPSCWGVRG